MLTVRSNYVYELPRSEVRQSMFGSEALRLSVLFSL